MIKTKYSKVFGVLLAFLLTLFLALQPASPAYASVSAVGENSGYSMRVEFGGNSLQFVDPDAGWEYAVTVSEENEVPVTITLLDDWCATNGNFGKYYEDDEEVDRYGFESGYMNLEDEVSNITIDLNGHAIDRKLTAATEDGYLFYVLHSTLTIKDSSKAQTGKITGGYNQDEGGAFYLYGNGTLNLQGGEISGNKASDGGAIYCYDNDFILNISGGKIVDNIAESGGGAISMERGCIYMTGGEISRNSAKYGGGLNLYADTFSAGASFYMSGGEIRGNETNGDGGAGIYWESKNVLCLTGGKITENIAKGGYGTVGGGLNVSRSGELYLGGTIYIKGNTSPEGEDNLYLFASTTKDLQPLRHAVGQEEYVPNDPLRGGAEIGLRPDAEALKVNYDNYMISDESGSLFDAGSFACFSGDDTSYYVRAVYDADEDGNQHALYFSTWSHADARYPKIKSVSVKDSSLLFAAEVTDYDNQIITLIATLGDMDRFKATTLDSLIYYSLNSDGISVASTGTLLDFRLPQSFKVMSDNGTYVQCKIIVMPYSVVTSEVDGDAISVNISNLNGTASVMVVQYDASGRMTDVQTLADVGEGTHSISGLTYDNGCSYKVFLVNSTSFSPISLANEF